MEDKIKEVTNDNEVLSKSLIEKENLNKDLEAKVENFKALVDEMNQEIEQVKQLCD